MLHYGILSTSSIAPRFIAGVRAAEAGEVVALSSRTVEKAREKAALWDIPTAYGSHAQLLADPQVDIVYISNVHTAHYPWAKAALEAGKHVVCEKPCTLSATQTAELYDLAREKGLFFMEAQKMLLLPAILEVQKRIRDGWFGPVRMAELAHSFDASYNNWMYDAAVGGGPIWASGIYVTELLYALFGPFETCSGICTALENGVECQYILSGRMENGVLFTAKNSTVALLRNGAALYGERGWVEIPDYWKARKLVFHPKNGEPEILEFPCEHELSYEADHVRRCIEQGLCESPVVTKALSVAGIAALEEIRSRW